MGRGTWSWIVPDGLWEIAEPLIPPSRARPHADAASRSPVQRAVTMPGADSGHSARASQAGDGCP